MSWDEKKLLTVLRRMNPGQRLRVKRRLLALIQRAEMQPVSDRKGNISRRAQLTSHRNTRGEP